MPFSIRKVYIDLCRLGQVLSSFAASKMYDLFSKSSRTHNQKSFMELITVNRYTGQDGNLENKEDLWLLYWKISTSGPVIRSFFLSVLLSCEAPHQYIDEASEEGLNKELKALMDSFQEGTMQISTRYLDGGRDNRTYEGWETISRHIVDSFYQKMKKKSALYPQVNRTKNVGRETAFAYSYWDPSKDIVDVTTADLQLLEYRLGVKIQGPCEVRRHFKFNDIKPRIYFAQGGTAFFNSRYMKYVAVELMESISATTMKNRDDPIYFLNTYSSWDDNIVMNWDLSSFTSTLQELRHFLHCFNRVLERRYGRAQVSIFDWKTGSTQVSLVKMIDEYNNNMNYHPDFSLIRLADIHETQGSTLSSRNGGLLGVPGNIGFSTFLHGLVSERACGDGNAICVGDDAMAVGSTRSLEILKQDISRIGRIAPEKFDEIKFYEDTKFLKRRVEFNPNGLVIDKLLFSIPVTYDFLGIEPYGRTTTNTPWIRRCKRMCQTFGAELWKFLSFTMETTDQDIKDFAQIQRAYYAVFHLPHDGCFPGYSISFDGEKMTSTFLVPPIPGMFDPRIVDWAEYMMENRKIRFVTIPKMVPSTIRPHELSLIEGETFVATKSEFVGYLEDIGIAVVDKIFETLDLEEFRNQRRFLRWVKRSGGKYLVEVRMTSTLSNEVNVSGICDVSWTDISQFLVETLE
jgi:hypothetical protein